MGVILFSCGGSFFCWFGTSNNIQCAAISFVYDIINRVATNDIKQLKIKIEEVDGVTEKELKERHVYLNKTTEQSILSFHGKGSMTAEGQLYTNTERGIDDRLRSLGPQLEET